MEVAVLRFPSLPSDAGLFLSSALPDLFGTIYEKRAPLEAAPGKTDCLTSIYYLFKKALGIEIPVTFVGDMPRNLESFGLRLEIIDTSEMKAGDLLFLKLKIKSRLISHVAIAISADKIFHCQKSDGVCLESPESIFETYEQELKKDQLLYIDFRNETVREKHAGYFVKPPLD